MMTGGSISEDFYFCRWRIRFVRPVAEHQEVLVPDLIAGFNIGERDQRQGAGASHPPGDHPLEARELRPVHNRETGVDKLHDTAPVPEQGTGKPRFGFGAGNLVIGGWKVKSSAWHGSAAASGEESGCGYDCDYDCKG